MGLLRGTFAALTALTTCACVGRPARAPQAPTGLAARAPQAPTGLAARAPQAPTVRAVPPARWSVAFHAPRASCDAASESSNLEVSADGTVLVDLCAEYDMATGARRPGPPRTAEFAPLVGSSDARFVSSARRGQRLAVEPRDERSETLVVREFAPPRVVCERRFLNPLHPRSAAVLDDGRLAVFAADGCRPARSDPDGNGRAFACATRGLYTVGPGCALEPLIAAEDVIAAVVSPDASRAVVVRRDGRGEVRDVPSGVARAVLPELPLEPGRGPDSVRVAVGVGAERVAVVGARGLRVYARAAEGYVTIFESAEFTWASLRFAPGDRALVVDDFETVTVVR